MGATTSESAMVVPSLFTDNTGAFSQGYFFTHPVSMRQLITISSSYPYLRRRTFPFLTHLVSRRLPVYSFVLTQFRFKALTNSSSLLSPQGDRFVDELILLPIPGAAPSDMVSTSAPTQQALLTVLLRPIRRVPQFRNSMLSGPKASMEYLAHPLPGSWGVAT
jgi:hypothetical protein